jgi:polyisoprenoid-binding protein YceI
MTASTTAITPVELKHWLDQEKAFHLINVMTPECPECSRLEGSVQACVYETAFLAQVQAITKDRGTTLVVYGVNRHSLAATQAVERLAAAGYEKVLMLEGGLQGWSEAGYPTLGTLETLQAVPSGRFELDTARSIVRWTGRNLLNHHEGTAPFTDGFIEIDKGQLVSASFTVDMTSLACGDLTDPTWNAMLIQHLSHNDFFATHTWPTAHFETSTASAVAGATDGSPNFEVSGAFTLRGVTQDTRFPISVGLADPQTLGAQADLDIDRTRWGANYGSGRLFEFLGKHLVSDWVHLHVKIVAVKSLSIRGE